MVASVQDTAALSDGQSKQEGVMSTRTVQEKRDRTEGARWLAAVQAKIAQAKATVEGTDRLVVWELSAMRTAWVLDPSQPEEDGVALNMAFGSWANDCENEVRHLTDQLARLRTDVALAARGALAPEEVRISHGIPDHEADALDPDVERAVAGKEAA